MSEPADAARGMCELQVLQSFRTILGSTRIHDHQARLAGGVSGSHLWALAEIASSHDG